ncbi:MAG: TIGR02452 family protein [Lachnospiraceae bacterium]|nr:TIGR02452 family protein [Lachnospiraceae bacterium]
MIDAREERRLIFQDTKDIYETNPVLKKAIKDSKEQQEVICEQEQMDIQFTKKDQVGNIIVSKKRSLEAAMAYKGKKVCVLNFASATNAGGGVVNGSSAQEEAICRCSTLYPCISEENTTRQFHLQHRKMLEENTMTALYNDDCIYTPNVVVFKTDTNQPKQMPQNDWFEVDIITCAAPNLRRIPSNRMNPNGGKTAAKISDKDLLNLHTKRIKRILDIAGNHKAEVVILGAFGCGAFQNPPQIVAEAMARVLKEYRNVFETIEFAVYCPPNDMTNYEVFKRRLTL